MASDRKTAANRANAARSTGPRTQPGKAAAKMNAVSHGLRAASLVTPGEAVEDWEAFRAELVASLAPADALEDELAGRAAELLWRLRRVTRYEAARTVYARDMAGAGTRHAMRQGSDARALGVIGADLKAARARAAALTAERNRYRRIAEAADAVKVASSDAWVLICEADRFGDADDDGYHADAEADLDESPEEPDARLARERACVTAAGVPAEFLDDPERWHGWTAAAVRAGLASIARGYGLSGAELLERAVRGTSGRAEGARRDIKKLAEELAAAKAEDARVEDEAADAQARIVLPPAEELASVARHEAHLNRQLTQTMLLLKGLQKGRAPLPALGPGG